MVKLGKVYYKEGITLPNEFKNKFQELKQRLVDYEYFSSEAVTVNVQNQPIQFIVYRFNLNKDILDNAIELAMKKSNFTMDYDQAGNKRPKSIKLANQTKGILAEIGVQLILEEILKCKSVKRWDLERETFKYLLAEYDVKFEYGGNDYLCESRSSTSYKTSLGEFIERYHIIGPYISKQKHSENNNDFYFRPVFQYINYNKKWSTLPYEKKTSVLEDLDSGELQLYFVSGATLDEMYSNNSEIGNNAQQGTKYRQIRMIYTGDVQVFLNNIVNIVKNR